MPRRCSRRPASRLEAGDQAPAAGTRFPPLRCDGHAQFLHLAHPRRIIARGGRGRRPARRELGRPDQPDLFRGPRRSIPRPRGGDRGARPAAGADRLCGPLRLGAGPRRHRRRLRLRRAGRPRRTGLFGRVPYFGSRGEVQVAVADARGCWDRFAEVPDGGSRAAPTSSACYPVSEDAPPDAEFKGRRRATASGVQE